MRGLRTQISLTIMLVVLFTVAVISLLSNALVNREFEKHIQAQQKVKAEDIVSNFKHQYNGLTQEWNLEYIHGVGMYALFDGYIVKVYDRNGGVVWDAENHDMSMCMQIMTEISARMEKRRPDIGGSFVAHQYDLTQGGQKIGSMAIRYYSPYFLSEGDFHFLSALNLVLAAIGAVSLILSFVIGGVLAKRIARPIAKTAYIARQISEDNYSLRFEGKTKSRELHELVTAINHLSGRLAEQENLRKQLTADVAHELRTPLSTLASHLEVMIEGVWAPTAERLQSCYEEIGRISGLVADLERLAKIENDNLVLTKTEVDLMDIVRAACDSFEIDIQKKNLSLVVRGESSFVQADRDKMHQVMMNLLSNAVKYTGENGHIWAGVRDFKDRGVLTVEDDGIGIPEEERALVFERFYRTDKSRNRKTGGAGIGLAIVKSIVTAHGGTVEAESRAKQGSRFVVTIPK